MPEYIVYSIDKKEHIIKAFDRELAAEIFFKQFNKEPVFVKTDNKIYKYRINIFAEELE